MDDVKVEDRVCLEEVGALLDCVTMLMAASVIAMYAYFQSFHLH